MKIKGNPDRVGILTLGCSKNTVDSEVLAGRLKAGGINVSAFDEQLQYSTVIINTCGFVEDAKRESVNTIIDFAEQKNSGKIKQLYVIGCLAERYKTELENELNEVDGFYGFADYEILYNRLEAESVTATEERQLTTPTHYAYLKIAEGCNRKCSFCAIPGIRGAHISRPVDDIIREAEHLALQGVKEIILISQDLAYYGMDTHKKKMLPVLVEQLARIRAFEWIRLHYLYPAQFPLTLLDVMEENPKICRYFDIPFQHISDPILKSMKRGINREKSLRLIDHVRSRFPDAALRTTLITGYPGEGRKEFNELLRFVKDIRFDRLGVFVYSHEEGTPAAKLNDSVSIPVKQRRMDALMQLQQEISWEKNRSMTGKICKVIIDRIEGDFYIGRTEFDSPEVDNEVLIPVTYKTLKPGSFYKVLINGADFFDLYAEPVNV